MKLLKNILKQIQEYIFPIFCLSCNIEGTWLCDNCFMKSESEFLGYFVKLDNNIKNISKHISIKKYVEGGVLEKIIHNIKYEYIDSLQKQITIIIKHFYINNHELFSDIDYIVPVPLHKRRLAERGFNQAELIANSLSLVTQIPVKNLLVRTKKTQQQAKLDVNNRAKNLKNAFICKYKLNNQTILLVDDVYTTGSTLDSAAKVLSTSGVQKITGFTLARAEMRNKHIKN